MATKNDFIWKLLHVISWLIFIGFCIQTGILLFNYIYSLFNPIATHNLDSGLNLSKIYAQSKLLYSILFLLVVLLFALKAIVFYYVLRMFKVLNLSKPFSLEVSQLISKISYYAFSAGIVGFIAHLFAKVLMKRGYEVDVIERYWDDTGAFMLMSAVVFIIATIFKKGIELQNENDLTV